MESLTLVFSRPETTSAVTRGAARVMEDLGFSPLCEVGLPNGRRADIMALSARGEIAVVEVKSSREDFLVDRKWGEYLPYCERFFFAIAPEFPRELLPEEPGLIVADAFGGAVLRESPLSLLAGARRKALLIAFGRLAAARASLLTLSQSPDAGDR
ncbi:MAG: DNA repair putative endonuclease MmcB [Caulobacteraceae bacterium]